MQRQHVEYDTIPQVVVPVERGLGCWGLRELIGHPLRRPWTGSHTGGDQTMGLVAGAARWGAASYNLLPGSWPCPFGRRLSSKAHLC